MPLGLFYCLSDLVFTAMVHTYHNIVCSLRACPASRAMISDYARGRHRERLRPAQRMSSASTLCASQRKMNVCKASYDALKTLVSVFSKDRSYAILAPARSRTYNPPWPRQRSRRHSTDTLSLPSLMHVLTLMFAWFSLLRISLNLEQLNDNLTFLYRSKNWCSIRSTWHQKRFIVTNWIQINIHSRFTQNLNKHE